MIIKNTKIFIYLIIFHLLITTTSNALVVFPVTFLGYKLTWAAFVFPLVVVATDLTVRLLGKKIAQKTITYTYPLAIIFSILVVFIEKDSLNIAFRVGFASATSYALGIIIDIFAFQQIRNNYKALVGLHPVYLLLFQTLLIHTHFSLLLFIIQKINLCLKIGPK